MGAREVGTGHFFIPSACCLGRTNTAGGVGGSCRSQGLSIPQHGGTAQHSAPGTHRAPPMQRSTRPLQHQPSVSPCSSRCCLLVMIYHMHSFGRANERFNYYIYPHRLLLSVSSPLRPPLRAHTRWQIPTAPQIPALAAGPPAPVALSPPTPHPTAPSSCVNGAPALLINPGHPSSPPQLDHTKGKVKRIQMHLSEGRLPLEAQKAAQQGRREGAWPGGWSSPRLPSEMAPKLSPPCTLGPGLQTNALPHSLSRGCSARSPRLPSATAPCQCFAGTNHSSLPKKNKKTKRSLLLVMRAAISEITASGSQGLIWKKGARKVQG